LRAITARDIAPATHIISATRATETAPWPFVLVMDADHLAAASIDWRPFGFEYARATLDLRRDLGVGWLRVRL
jgi:hypothetical protein